MISKLQFQFLALVVSCCFSAGGYCQRPLPPEELGNAATQSAKRVQQSDSDSPKIDARLLDLKKEADEISAAVEAWPQEQAEKPLIQQRIAALVLAQNQIEANEQEIQALQTQVETAKDVSLKLTEQISQMREQRAKESDFAELDFVELNTLKTEIETEIQKLRAEKQAIAEMMANAPKRKEQLETESLVIEKKLESSGQTNAKQEAPTSLTERLAAIEADTNLLQLNQQLTLVGLQQQWQDVSSQFDLRQKQTELITLQIAFNESIAKIIDETLAGWRQQEANALANQASEAAADTREKYPLLATSEAINVKLANDIGELEAEATKVVADDRKLQYQLLEVVAKYDRTRRTINQIGQSNTVGAMLRKRKSELPTVQSREQQAAEARRRIEEIQASRFQDSEELNELSVQTVREEIEESGVDLTPKQWDRLIEPAERLIKRRKELLRSREKIFDRLFNANVDIETTNSRVVTVVRQFNNFINERILWLRSNKILFTELKIDKADRAVFSADKWTEVGPLALNSLQKRPLLSSVSALVVLVLLMFRSNLRRRVDKFGETAARGSCTTFWPTGRAMILTVVIAVTVPLLLCAAGWILKQSTPSASRLFDAMATGLWTAGLFAIPVEVLRRACRPNGMAVKHFDWSDSAVAKLKFHLDWFVLPASSIVFVVSLLEKLDTAHRIDLIERIFFTVGILMTAWMFYRLLSPTRGIFSQFLKRNEMSWANQTRSIWVTAVVLIPISLAVLAVSGYYYTSLNLTYCLCLTFAFAVGVELARALVRRFVMVRQRVAYVEGAKRKRQLEIEAAKEARKQAAAQRQQRIDAGEDVDEAPMVPVASLGELQFDFKNIEVNAGHANQLIRLLGFTAWFIGLWLVWSEVLPAIKALDEYKLWGATVATTNESDSATSTAMLMAGLPPAPSDAESDEKDSGETLSEGTGSSPVEANAPLFSLDPPTDDGVSVRDFLIFIAIVLLTFFAARNLPNAFEMLFLEDLPFDRSARYASKSIVSYAIVIVGAGLALRTLSIDWSSIQWLVTALTFGLAFGLQEIFANFVAGIILMFERPMRLGDLITVDEFTGIVTRIRTRATTIVNFDRKEYVIPNKDFITGRLVNWTLSDAINRIQFTVGVAYGSDVSKAKTLIFEICKSHPSIVDDPPTSITFEEFGDSTLNLVVRTFLGEVSSRLAVIDALHSQINTKFNEAGIEIAFPQHDLNLRTVDQDVARLLSRSDREEG